MLFNRVFKDIDGGTYRFRLPISNCIVLLFTLNNTEKRVITENYPIIFYFLLLPCEYIIFNFKNVLYITVLYNT